MVLQRKDSFENRQHSTDYIPYSFYECNIPHIIMNVPMHWHSEFEIDYVVRGAGEFTCGGEKYAVGEGGLFVLPPNMLHAANPAHGSELIYYAFVFNPALLGANARDRCAVEYIRPLVTGSCKFSPFIPHRAQNYPLLKTSIKQIFDCILGCVPQADLLLKSELLRFFWLLETDNSIQRQKETKSGCEENIRPALDFMMRNYHESISVAQLAAASHLSKSYFMNCFKKAVGLSAIEYLRQLRINAACEALASTKKAVYEIALNCGYENLSNFNRQFKKTMGCSPKEYRKQCYIVAH